MISRNEKSVIDILIIEENNLKRIMDNKVRRECEIGSKHYPVTSIIEIKLTGGEKQRSLEMR